MVQNIMFFSLYNLPLPNPNSKYKLLGLYYLDWFKEYTMNGCFSKNGIKLRENIQETTKTL